MERYSTCRELHCHPGRIFLTRVIGIVGREHAASGRLSSAARRSNSCGLTRCNISTPPWQYFSLFRAPRWVYHESRKYQWMTVASYAVLTWLLEDRDSVQLLFVQRSFNVHLCFVVEKMLVATVIIDTLLDSFNVVRYSKSRIHLSRLRRNDVIMLNVALEKCCQLRTNDRNADLDISDILTYGR